MNVPQIQEPSAQEQAIRPTPEGTAPLSAYPGAVGESGERSGTKAEKLIYDEKLRAGRDTAVKNETDYLGYGMDARDKFYELHGENALKVSEEVKQGLYDKMMEGAAQIRSRSGRDAYLAGTMRNWRILEGQINSHTTQERKTIGTEGFNNGLIATAKLLDGAAHMGADFDAKKVQDVLEKKQAEVYQRAADLGMSHEDAHDFAIKSMGVPVGALITGLAKAGDPRATAMLNSDWGKYIAPGPRDSISSIIQAHADKNVVAGLMAKFTRVDYGGPGTPPRIDPHGHIDEEEVFAAQNYIRAKASTDEDAQRQISLLDREVKAEHTADVAQGAQLGARVQRMGQGINKDGSNGLPLDSQEWADFQRLYPVEAGALQEKYAVRAARSARAFTATEKQESAGTRGRTFRYLLERPADEIKMLQPEDVAMKMQLDNPHVSDGDIAKMQKELATLQKGAVDPLTSKFPITAQQVLKAAYGSKDPRTLEFEGKAISFLMDEHEMDKGGKLNIGDLAAKLKVEFTKPGWDEDRPGEKYTPRDRPVRAAPRVAPTVAPPPAEAAQPAIAPLVAPAAKRISVFGPGGEFTIPAEQVEAFLKSEKGKGFHR